jgi:hypothetical protein
MTNIRIDEALWAGAMSPKGMLLAWTEPEGATVSQGVHVADVVIEGCRHRIMSPASGQLHHEVEAPFVLDPGSVIGRVGGEARPA